MTRACTIFGDQLPVDFFIVDLKKAKDQLNHHQRIGLE